MNHAKMSLNLICLEHNALSKMIEREISCAQLATHYVEIPHFTFSSL